MMPLVIGSRGSQLALWQAEWARRTLESGSPDRMVTIEVIRTLGDRDQRESFAEIGGKGVFTKEVDEALLAGRTDLSIHSLKDLPTEMPDWLVLAAVSPRADVRDALISDATHTLAELPEGAKVATSSLRRQALLKASRPDLVLHPLRGNIDTRLKKLGTESLDAIVLASAGLDRLGLEGAITERLTPETFVPAPGQGVMGVVCRREDSVTVEAVACLNDRSARVAIDAERSALNRLGGGCRIPFGAWARETQGSLTVDGVVAHPDGSSLVRGRLRGSADGAVDLGVELAEDLLARGARSILDEVLSR